MTITIDLPDHLIEYIQTQITTGPYTTIGEYIQALIEQDIAQKAQLETLILESIHSGPSTPMTQDDWNYIRHTVHENHRQRKNNQTPIDPDLANDPLFKLIGCIHSDIPDLAENHDYYIGQALYEEMHRNE